MVLLKVLAALLVIQVAIADDAKLGQFPFHVSIQKVTKDKADEHVCSGALIKKNFVLTSANCVYNSFDKTSYVIKTNALETTSTNKVQIKKVNNTGSFIHEDYKPSGLFYNEHDIAILRLTEDVKLDKDVALVDLPKSKVKINGTKVSTMIGYEFESGENLAKDKLKFFETRVMANPECIDSLKLATANKAKLFNSQFCVSDLKDKHIYTVKGDSGNTLVQKTGDKNEKTELIGLAASYSAHKDVHNKPIFTQVSLYVDWINKKTSNGAFSVTCGYLVLIVAAISVTKNLFY